jgi:hypothetical protein
MQTEIEEAREPLDVREKYPTLFALSEYTEQSPSTDSVCERLGLNRIAAQALFAEGWLSFDPEETAELSSSQRAELTFVGTLAVAGADRTMLRRLLSGLEKPYAYRLNRVYYDWPAQRWRLLGEFEGQESGFEEWVEELVAWRDLERLKALRESIERAISYMQGVQDRAVGL